MSIRSANLVLVCCALIVGSHALVPGEVAHAAGSPNGVAGSMPAYYDHTLFTINFFRLTTAQATLLAKNSQQNTIYQSDPGLPGGAPFISVIDAIPADGFNPLWAEVQIAFTAGHTPRQLFSDDEINTAAANHEITLTPTHEMYRCAVINVIPRTTGSSRAVSAIGSRAAAPRTNGSTAVGAKTRVTSWGEMKAAYR